ncbi:MAG: hypothetical protein CMJ19_02725 [Phycisphaeraceae bacterium]|nr:hypothetical protein [Phycisphaeraceae bacterium]
MYTIMRLYSHFSKLITIIIATTKHRIVQFIEAEGISKQQFYANTGLKRGLLDADKLEGAISDTHLAKIIATYPELDPLWLLTGKGDMKKKVFEIDLVAEPKADYGKCGHCADKQRIIELQQEVIDNLKRRIDELESGGKKTG